MTVLTSKRSWNLSISMASDQTRSWILNWSCRMVVIHSMASYVIRHGSKFVASHFWFLSFHANFCRVAQVTRVGRAQVVGQSLIRHKASRVSRRCITSVSRRSDRGCGSGIRVYADRRTNGLRGSRARTSVVVRSQVTLITLPIIFFFCLLVCQLLPDIDINATPRSDDKSLTTAHERSRIFQLVNRS